MSPSIGASALYPWLPPVDRSVAAAFAVDDFVVAEDEVPVSGVPGGEPYRFDTGDPDPATHPLMSYGRVPLVVVHGPVVVDRVQWYLMTSAQLVIDTPTGWSPVTSPSGSQWINAAPIECPPTPMHIDELAPLGLTDGLAACYGRTELTITGDLGCTPEPDASVTGAEWLAGGWCQFEASDASPSAPFFSVYGLEPDLAPGTYAVTGHFDDPAAADCLDPNQTGAIEQLSAVLSCRKAFVATAAVPVP